MTERDHSEGREVLLAAGGAALMLIGAGLLLTHRGIRRKVIDAVTPLLNEMQGPLKSGVRRVFPDVERYLKSRTT